jgi:hypothetical protein
VKSRKQTDKHWNNSNRFTAKAFRPYAEAIGHVALAWNELHETLGTIFTEVGFEGSDKAQAAWQSLIVDRAKREMLKAVLTAMTEFDFLELPKFRDDVIWIIEQAHASEDGRNSAIHTPLLLHDHPIWQEVDEGSGISSFSFRGNTRAKRLKQKDVLVEYRYHRDKFITLQKFADELLHWRRGTPWPKRPRLPSRKQRKTRQGQPRASFP